MSARGESSELAWKPRRAFLGTTPLCLVLPPHRKSALHSSRTARIHPQPKTFTADKRGCGPQSGLGEQGSVEHGLASWLSGNFIPHPLPPFQAPQLSPTITDLSRAGFKVLPGTHAGCFGWAFHTASHMHLLLPLQPR